MIFCRNAVDEALFGARQPWQSQITCKIHQAKGITQELVARVPKSAKSMPFLHFGTTWPLAGKWPGHTQEGADQGHPWHATATQQGFLR